MAQTASSSSCCAVSEATRGPGWWFWRCHSASVPSFHRRPRSAPPRRMLSDRRRDSKKHRFRATRGNPSMLEVVVGELDHITAQNMQLGSLFLALQVKDSDVVWPGSAFEMSLPTYLVIRFYQQPSLSLGGFDNPGPKESRMQLSLFVED
ncbi:hypothetical protein V8C44DRAFT_315633 [Trichoderma aethiopicum]